MKHTICEGCQKGRALAVATEQANIYHDNASVFAAVYEAKASAEEDTSRELTEVEFAESSHLAEVVGCYRQPHELAPKHVECERNGIQRLLGMCGASTVCDTSEIQTA